MSPFKGLSGRAARPRVCSSFVALRRVLDSAYLRLVGQALTDASDFARLYPGKSARSRRRVDELGATITPQALSRAPNCSIELFRALLERRVIGLPVTGAHPDDLRVVRGGDRRF
jgi:hypothetical protein